MAYVYARVLYGKKGTPKKNREYRLVEQDGRLVVPLSAPVGTRKEINEWARNIGIPRTRIKIVEENEGEYIHKKRLKKVM